VPMVRLHMVSRKILAKNNNPELEASDPSIPNEHKPFMRSSTQCFLYRVSHGLIRDMARLNGNMTQLER
jgi:hypothetical protein